MQQPDKYPDQTDRHKPTEDQVDMKDTVAQRINKQGQKLEDMGGTGEHDSQGG